MFAFEATHHGRLVFLMKWMRCCTCLGLNSYFNILVSQLLESLLHKHSRTSAHSCCWCLMCQRFPEETPFCAGVQWFSRMETCMCVAVVARLSVCFMSVLLYIWADSCRCISLHLCIGAFTMVSTPLGTHSECVNDCMILCTFTKEAAFFSYCKKGRIWSF